MKVGDIVKRMMARDEFMTLQVTKLTDNLIICGPWKFNKDTGAEIDLDLGWTKFSTGTYLAKDPETKEILIVECE